MFQTMRNYAVKAVGAVQTKYYQAKEIIKSAFVEARDLVCDHINAAKAVVGGTLFGIATSASAAVPTDVTTAITTAATDVATVGAAVVVVMVGIKVFKWLIRAL
jgi:hypothetical protein